MHASAGVPTPARRRTPSSEVPPPRGGRNATHGEGEVHGHESRSDPSQAREGLALLPRQARERESRPHGAGRRQAGSRPAARGGEGPCEARGRLALLHRSTGRCVAHKDGAARRPGPCSGAWTGAAPERATHGAAAHGAQAHHAQAHDATRHRPAAHGSSRHAAGRSSALGASKRRAQRAGGERGRIVASAPGDARGCEARAGSSSRHKKGEGRRGPLLLPLHAAAPPRFAASGRDG